MPALASYDYAIVRVVPRVERGECINVGVILFCRTRRFLGARIELDPDRFAAFAPRIDRAALVQHLDVLPRIAAGDRGAGPLARLSLAERFHWLVAPRSAIIQVSPVHVGLCSDPAREIERLLDAFVR